MIRWIEKSRLYLSGSDLCDAQVQAHSQCRISTKSLCDQIFSPQSIVCANYFCARFKDRLQFIQNPGKITGFCADEDKIGAVLPEIPNAAAIILYRHDMRYFAG